MKYVNGDETHPDPSNFFTSEQYDNFINYKHNYLDQHIDHIQNLG